MYMCPIEFYAYGPMRVDEVALLWVMHGNRSTNRHVAYT
jgi:hypothetical protein